MVRVGEVFWPQLWWGRRVCRLGRTLRFVWELKMRKLHLIFRENKMVATGLYQSQHDKFRGKLSYNIYIYRLASFIIFL